MRTLRVPIVLFAVLLALKFACLAAARLEVRDGGSQWQRLAGLDGGRYAVHIGVEGREAPLLVIYGDMTECDAATDVFIEALTGGIDAVGAAERASSEPQALGGDGWTGLPGPAQAAIDCVLSELATCCGTTQMPPCPNFCWVSATVTCSTPEMGGPCVVSCFSPGCQDDHCLIGGIWCECPDPPPPSAPPGQPVGAPKPAAPPDVWS